MLRSNRDQTARVSWVARTLLVFAVLSSVLPGEVDAQPVGGATCTDWNASSYGYSELQNRIADTGWDRCAALPSYACVDCTATINGGPSDSYDVVHCNHDPDAPGVCQVYENWGEVPPPGGNPEDPQNPNP